MTKFISVGLIGQFESPKSLASGLVESVLSAIKKDPDCTWEDNQHVLSLRDEIRRKKRVDCDLVDRAIELADCFLPPYGSLLIVNGDGELMASGADICGASDFTARIDVCREELDDGVRGGEVVRVSDPPSSCNEDPELWREAHFAVFVNDHGNTSLYDRFGCLVWDIV